MKKLTKKEQNEQQNNADKKRESPSLSGISDDEEDSYENVEVHETTQHATSGQINEQRANGSLTPLNYIWLKRETYVKEVAQHSMFILVHVIKACITCGLTCEYCMICQSGVFYYFDQRIKRKH